MNGKPLSTLKHFPSPKYRALSEKETNEVYKIPCADCSWSYIGETSTSFDTRKKEYIRNVKYFAENSNIANHSWTHGHKIDFSNGHIINKGGFRIRRTSESWHMASAVDADKNSKPLPQQYSTLFRKQWHRRYV